MSKQCSQLTGVSVPKWFFLHPQHSRPPTLAWENYKRAINLISHIMYVWISFFFFLSFLLILLFVAPEREWERTLDSSKFVCWSDKEKSMATFPFPFVVLSRLTNSEQDTVYSSDGKIYCFIISIKYIFCVVQESSSSREFLYASVNCQKLWKKSMKHKLSWKGFRALSLSLFLCVIVIKMNSQTFRKI